MNAPAQDLMGDDFNLVQGRPAARDLAGNRRLQQLISLALHVERGSAQGFAPIVVDRDGRLGFWLRQCPSRRSEATSSAPVV